MEESIYLKTNQKLITPESLDKLYFHIWGENLKGKKISSNMFLISGKWLKGRKACSFSFWGATFAIGIICPIFQSPNEADGPTLPWPLYSLEEVGRTVGNPHHEKLKKLQPRECRRWPGKERKQKKGWEGLKTKANPQQPCVVPDQRPPTSSPTRTGTHNRPCWERSLQGAGPNAPSVGKYFINDNDVHLFTRK